MWEKVPYALWGSPANWEIEKENHGKSLLNLLARFASNLTQHAVINSFVQSPVDTERTLPNMKFGDLLVGSFANNQVSYNRPFPGAGEYKTPVKACICAEARPTRVATSQDSAVTMRREY